MCELADQCRSSGKIDNPQAKEKEKDRGAGGRERKREKRNTQGRRQEKRVGKRG